MVVCWRRHEPSERDTVCTWRPSVNAPKAVPAVARADRTYHPAVRPADVPAVNDRGECKAADRCFPSIAAAAGAMPTLRGPQSRHFPEPGMTLATAPGCRVTLLSLVIIICCCRKLWWCSEEGIAKGALSCVRERRLLEGASTVGGGGVAHQRELECLLILSTHAWGGGRVEQRVEEGLEGNERTGD